MDLTNEDVADVLALLDSLPYDSLDLETSRFRLTLRRAPGGGWTEESQVLAEPTVLALAPDAVSAPASAPAGPARAASRNGTGHRGIRLRGPATATGGTPPTGWPR